MDNCFKQICVSGSLDYFKDFFKKKWDLEDYTNVNEPAIFFGLYHSHEIKRFVNHKGKKMIIWGGADQHINKFQSVKNLPNFVGSPAYRPPMVNTFKKIGYPYKEIILPFKDYSNLETTPLGDKIYVYKGLNGNRKHHYKWDEIVVPLIKHFGKNRVIYSQSQKIDYIINELYNKSFVYVKPNELGGSTTMWEMAHMGRKTISKNQGNLPNVINFTDLKSIINTIKNEEKKIGTIQKEVAEETKKCMVNNKDWLNVKFWEK